MGGQICWMSEKIWQLQIAQWMSTNTSIYCTNVQIVFLLIRISYKVNRLTDSVCICIVLDLPMGNFTTPTMGQHLCPYFPSWNRIWKGVSTVQETKFPVAVSAFYWDYCGFDINSIFAEHWHMRYEEENSYFDCIIINVCHDSLTFYSVNLASK